MRQLLLGLDIGTSACKAAVFTREGCVLAEKTEKYPSYYPTSGWIEQDPNDWWRVVCASLQSIFATGDIHPEEIEGIGVDGHSWAPVFVGQDGEVLARAPLWLDRRSEEECRYLREKIGDREIFKVAGNPLQPMYATGKALWFKRHMPDVLKRTDKVLSTNGYIVYCLTGARTMDVSQGYSWHCFDMRRGCWDREMADAMGIPRNILPDLCDCQQVVGTVTEEAASMTGLLPGTKVVAGGVDAACATLGAGVIHDGECQEQGGQAGGISICIGEYKADPGLILGMHVVPGCWLLQGGTTGGGGVMRWIEQEFGQYERMEAEKSGQSSFEQMNELASGVSPGSDGMVFLPYMSGERTPVWNPRAKGVFYGLDYAKTKAHMIRAAMEGVAYSLRHNIEVAEAAGCRVDRLRATGGAANSLLWTQIKADITGRDFIVPRSDMATVLGTALVAGVGTGVYRNYEEAVDLTIKIERAHCADRSCQDIYDKNYKIYRNLYDSLETIMNGD